MCAMWKSSSAQQPIQRITQEVAPPAPPQASVEPVRPRTVAVATESAAIGKGLRFKGVITGEGSLFVDGEVVGNIFMPDSRVTVGPNGHVSDGLSICVNAREIIIMGEIRGNISAADRVEIRAEGTLIGNVSTARISIADGAYFKGDIDLTKRTEKGANPANQEISKALYA